MRRRTRRKVSPHGERLAWRGGLAALLVALVAVFGTGCGDADDGGSSAALEVVASTSFLADITQNVAGERARVRALVPSGTDPHAFAPAPADLRRVAGAALLVVNGAGLEGSLLTILQDAVGDVRTIEASSGLAIRTPHPGEPQLAQGEQDPHFWLDPLLVKTYVRNIAAALAAADPAGAATYEANAAEYDERLDALHAWIEEQVADVPEADRLLVMDHVSQGYFADRYGFTVVGTILPGATTGGAPSARRLNELVATIRDTGAKAIFVDAGEDTRLAEQVASETGVKVVAGLLDHSLTGPDGPAPSYIAMMKYDTRLIVKGLE